MEPLGVGGSATGAQGGSAGSQQLSWLCCFALDNIALPCRGIPTHPPVRSVRAQLGRCSLRWGSRVQLAAFLSPRALAGGPSPFVEGLPLGLCQSLLVFSPLCFLLPAPAAAERSQPQGGSEPASQTHRAGSVHAGGPGSLSEDRLRGSHPHPGASCRGICQERGLSPSVGITPSLRAGESISQSHRDAAGPSCSAKLL